MTQIACCFRLVLTAQLVHQIAEQVGAVLLFVRQFDLFFLLRCKIFESFLDGIFIGAGTKHCRAQLVFLLHFAVLTGDVEGDFAFFSAQESHCLFGIGDQFLVIFLGGFALLD